MAKIDKDEILFDKKSSINILNQNDLEEEKNTDMKYDDEEDDDNDIDESYDYDVLNFIERNIVEYVKKNAIPLCEYITIEKIDKFLDNIKA
jgi:hypothetical protein